MWEMGVTYKREFDVDGNVGGVRLTTRGSRSLKGGELPVD